MNYVSPARNRVLVAASGARHEAMFAMCYSWNAQAARGELLLLLLRLRLVHCGYDISWFLKRILLLMLLFLFHCYG